MQMPIIDLQRRARELGRIRMGQVVTTASGKRAPSKLDKFRITSPSQALIEQVARLYGGQARPWTPQGGGAEQWEVLTESTRLPVLVPPQPVSQWYETWSGGGCQRRCDGVREVINDTPCVCGPDPQERECKPTTRLNVVLSDVEGVGVWRLETHGYYAAVELPSAAELLAASNGYISGHLALEERVVKREGKTKRFMVPTLEVGVTPAQLMAGNGAMQISGPAPRELSVPAPRAIEAAPAAPLIPTQLDKTSVENALKTIQSGGTLQDIRDIWPQVKEAGLEEAALKIVAEFQEAEKKAAAVAQPEAAELTADAVWNQIMQSVPEDWSTSKVEEHFAEVTGVAAEKAGAGQMAVYLKKIRAGQS